MFKKVAILLLFSFPATACDGIYFEFGIGGTANEDIYLTPTGKALIGYSRNGWMLEYEHISSIPDTEDDGLNVFWATKRIYLE